MKVLWGHWNLKKGAKCGVTVFKSWTHNHIWITKLWIQLFTCTYFCFDTTPEYPLRSRQIQSRSDQFVYLFILGENRWYLMNQIYTCWSWLCSTAFYKITLLTLFNWRFLRITLSVCERRHLCCFINMHVKRHFRNNGIMGIGLFSSAWHTFLQHWIIVDRQSFWCKFCLLCIVNDQKCSVQPWFCISM